MCLIFADWTVAARHVEWSGELRDVNLWIDSSDFPKKEVKGKGGQQYWSYKLNKPGLHYMMLQDGRCWIFTILSHKISISQRTPLTTCQHSWQAMTWYRKWQKYFLHYMMTTQNFTVDTTQYLQILTIINSAIFLCQYCTMLKGMAEAQVIMTRLGV